MGISAVRLGVRRKGWKTALLLHTLRVWVHQTRKSHVWWCIPVTPVFRKLRLRQEGGKLEVSLGYVVRQNKKNPKIPEVISPVGQQGMQEPGEEGGRGRGFTPKV